MTFQRDLRFKGKYSLWTDGMGEKNEGRSLCKVFFDKKKEALYANLLTCVFSASATLVLCKRKVTFVHQLQYYEWFTVVL